MDFILLRINRSLNKLLHNQIFNREYLDKSLELIEEIEYYSNELRNTVNIDILFEYYLNLYLNKLIYLLKLLFLLIINNINNLVLLYKIIILLFKCINVYIFSSILSLFSLKFTNSSTLYAKRPRSPESENQEKSAWKKRQEDIQEIEMDLKDLRKDIKEAENAAKIENNISFSHEVKSNNSHLRHIERNYSEFFDTNDDHQTTNKGLNRVIEYLKIQEKTFNKELEELKKTPNQVLDDLPSEMPNITEEND